MLWATAGGIATLAVAVHTLPDLIARHVLAEHLERLGVVHQGLRTLEVEILEGEVAVGPLTLRLGDAAPAALDRLDLDVGLRALFDDRILIQHLVVSGVELAITAGAGGGVTINGQPVPAPAARGSLRDIVRALLGGRDLGIERLEIRTSRLVLRDANGAERALDVERLTLSNALAWEPARAASFELAARANGASLRASGELTPFDDEPSLTAETTIEDAEVALVQWLLGSGDADRQIGTAAFEGRLQATSPGGGARVLRAEGLVTLTDVALRTGAGTSVSLKRAGARVRVERLGGGAAPWRVQGNLALDADTVALSIPDHAELTASALEMTLDQVEVGPRGDSELTASWLASVVAEDGRFSGRIRLSTDLLVNVIRALQFLTDSTGQGAQSTGLEAWADRSVRTPRSEIEFARLAITDQRAAYNGGGGAFSLALDTAIEAANVRVESRTQESRIDGIAVSLEGMKLGASDGTAALAGSLAARVRALSGARGQEAVGAFEAADLRIDAFDLRADRSVLTGSLNGQSELAGLSGEAREIAGTGRPPARFSVNVVRTRIDEARLSADPGAAQWSLRGSAEAAGVALDVGSGLLATASFDRARFDGVTLDETLSGRATSVVLDGTELAATHTFLAALLSGELRAKGSAGPPTEAQPGAPARDEGKALVEDIQWLLDELGHEPGPLDGLVGKKTVAAIEAFQKTSGLTVDGRPTRGLLAALEAAARKTRRARTPGRRSPTLAIERMVAENGAQVHFSDDTLDPDVDTVVQFETLSVTGFDGADPDHTVEILAAARVNEFGQLSVQGHVTPFKRPLDVDLDVRLTEVDLPAYSPYMRRETGIQVEEGVLSAETTAAINAGAIDGNVKLEVRRLQIGELAPEDAERAAATIGVNPETAMRLLKDAEGRIVLTLPVSGTVDEPEVDISDAVNQAVVGVLAAVFPPNIIASMFKGDGEDDVRFEPVAFEPGSVSLGDAARDYLGQFASLMREHPGVTVAVCGRAVAADVKPIAAMLSERLGATVGGGGDGAEPDRKVVSHAGALAVDRGRTTRQYLVAERGIDSARLTECRAVFDRDDPGRPRVELRL